MRKQSKLLVPADQGDLDGEDWHVSIAIAVIQEAMGPKGEGQQFPAWLMGPCGRFWASIAGVDPEVLYAACRRTLRWPAEDQYRELRRCPTCRQRGEVLPP